MAEKKKRKSAPRRFPKAKAEELFRILAEDRPDPHTELNFVNPYTLVVAVALSAQATDVGVNKATKKLFEIADTPEKMLALGEEGVADHIKTIGLWRNKAKNVIALSDMLIKDFGGTDDYDGGNGPADTLSYDTWYADPVGAIQGIVADLGAGTVVGPDGFTDTIKNIESIRGTFLDDVIIGDENANTFIGYQGADDFNGKGGTDLLDYRNDEFQGGLDGIEVNVKKGTVRDGFGSTDTFKNIESFRGTGEKDVFKDHKGDQSYFGRNGNDRFELAKGNDYVEAGSGADKFIFKGKSFGNDTLNDYDEADGDTLEIQKLKKFNELTITQTGDDTLVEWNSSSILLRNVEATDITAEDFGL